MDEWIPTEKQSEFLQLPYSILEGFYAGAVGAGKSDVLLIYPFVHRLHENERFKGLFLRRTFTELKNEIIPRSQYLFPKFGGDYNINDKCWRFPSGALFFFGHCENENDVHNYDSMQPNYVAFDELTSFTEWQYLYITLQRVRTTINSRLPAIVRCASNPGNIGHNWVRKRFIDPAPQGFKLVESPSGIKRIFIPATIKDNPHIDPSYLKSLEALPEAEKQAKLYGKWDAYEGAVFDEFRDKKYPDEPDNAIHVVDEFDIPGWWPKLVSCDWGYASPAGTWVGYGAISPYKRLYLYREQYWEGKNRKKISEWTPYVREYIEREQPSIIRLCKSAGQDRGDNHTIQQQIEEGLGRSVELTSNLPGSRIATKLLLHEYFRWKSKYVPTVEQVPFNEEHAMWLLRNRGPREYQSYIDTYSSQQDEHIPKIQIFNCCPFVINAIKSCVYDKVHTEDVAEFPGDDPYDGLRYLVDAADLFFIQAEREFNKLQKREQLSVQLERTGDVTAFYRNARKLDSETRVKPIQMFHNGRRRFRFN